MDGNVVIATVVCVVIAAHVVLFRWVQFKIDEGAILKVLQEEGSTFLSAQTISSSTQITAGRVSAVCTRSKSIAKSTVEKESWCAGQPYEIDTST